MILSNIVVALFLQNTVQIGLAEGVDFKGKLRTEIANSADSKAALDAWIESAAMDKAKPLSFCVVESDSLPSNSLSDHLLKRLIARQESGHFDIISTPENVARLSRTKDVRDVDFVHTAGYCWMTFANRTQK